MRWEISGADRQTGKDVRVELDADSEAAAVKAAGATGMLVSAARQLPTPPTLPYAGPSTPPPRAEPQQHADSIHGGKTVRDKIGAAERAADFGAGFGATGCNVCAALAYVGGVLALLNGCGRQGYSPDRFSDDHAYGAAANALEAMLRESEGWKTFLGGVMLMILGALWQLTGHVIRTRQTTRALAILLKQSGEAK